MTSWGWITEWWLPEYYDVREIDDVMKEGELLSDDFDWNVIYCCGYFIQTSCYVSVTKHVIMGSQLSLRHVTLHHVELTLWVTLWIMTSDADSIILWITFTFIVRLTIHFKTIVFTLYAMQFSILWHTVLGGWLKFRLTRINSPPQRDVLLVIIVYYYRINSGVVDIKRRYWFVIIGV